MKSGLTYRHLLERGWNKTKEHFWFLLVAETLCLTVALFTFPVPLMGTTAAALLTMAALSVALVIVRNQRPSRENTLRPFHSFDTVWHYFLATIMYTIIVFFGTVLFILPGIFLAMRLQFYTFSILENSTVDAAESLKQSWHITSGHFWKLFGFTLLFLIIVLISIVPLGLGLIFALPVLLIAYAELYTHISHRSRADTLSSPSL